MKKTLSVILSIMLIMTFAFTSLGLTSIAVESIKSNTGDITLQVGKTYTLKVTITPVDATNKKLTYSSGNKNIATVDKNGKIKGIKAGKTVITVISSSNRKAVAKFNVTISPVKKEPKELRVVAQAWMMGKYKLVEAGVQFEKAHPGVKVIFSQVASADTTTNMLEWSTGKTNSDLALGGSREQAVQYAAKDLIINFDQGFFDDKLKKEDFFPSFLELGNIDGTQYMIPMLGEVMFIVVNKSLMKKAGLADDKGVIKLPATWDELYEYAKKATVVENGKTVQTGLSIDWGTNFMAYSYFACLQGLKGSFLESDNKTIDFTSKEAKDLLTAWCKLVKDGYSPIDSFADADAGRSNFKAGRVAMHISAASRWVEAGDLLGAANITVGCRDMKYSLGLQLSALRESMKYKGDIANFLEPWYGIGTVAGAFVQDYVWHENQAPAIIAPFSSLKDALEYNYKPISETSIGKYTLEMIEYFMQETKGKIPVSFTDTQAPLNIAAQLLNITTLFLEIYDNPEDYLKLLEIISDLLIVFTYKQSELIGNALVSPGHGFPSSWSFSGLGMSDDNMLMLSNDMYEENEIPFREKIGKAFGGAVFHSCGDWSKKISTVKKIKNLVMADGAFAEETDPCPNQIEPFANEFANTGIALNARIVGDIDTITKNVRRLWKPGMKLIVTTYCKTPEEQEAVYLKIHEICG